MSESAAEKRSVVANSTPTRSVRLARAAVERSLQSCASRRDRASRQLHLGVQLGADERCAGTSEPRHA